MSVGNGHGGGGPGGPGGDVRGGDGPDGDRPGGDRPGEPDGAWVVWRQDDNGNQFVVARRCSRSEAEELAAELEARGHKQTYWVASAG